jgi:hypothetical protein
MEDRGFRPQGGDAEMGKKDRKTPSGEKVPRIDYDNLMKTTLMRFLLDALALFLPELYAVLDMSAKPEFLNTEFPKATFDMEGGAKRADVLARLHLLKGCPEGGSDPKVVLCHVEIQGKGGGNLAERMQKYREYIHLTYGVEPDVVIVVIIGPRPKGEPVSYYFESGFGVRVVYEYVTVNVMAMPDELLLANDNRMGLVLYAMKRARLSGDDEGMKFRYLRELSALWAERKWSPEDKVLVLAAMEYLMSLKDEDYARQYVEHMASLTESMKRGEENMYKSVFERVYTAKGMEKGIAQGRTEVARNMLRKGFSIDSVVECTTLPRREVESLAGC